jgi:hypothetical protein
VFKLGYTFDVGFVGTSADLSTTAITGKRTNVRNFQNPNFLVELGAAASGTADVVLTINQWQASSGGSAQPYVADHVWVKGATLLANTEVWTNVANALTDGTLHIPGATYATKQTLALVELHVPSLLPGYDYVSVDIATVAVARTANVQMLAADLSDRYGPANLQPLLF